MRYDARVHNVINGYFYCLPLPLLTSFFSPHMPIICRKFEQIKISLQRYSNIILKHGSLKGEPIIKIHWQSPFIIFLLILWFDRFNPFSESWLMVMMPLVTTDNWFAAIRTHKRLFLTKAIVGVLNIVTTFFVKIESKIMSRVHSVLQIFDKMTCSLTCTMLHHRLTSSLPPLDNTIILQIYDYSNRTK